MCVLRTVLLFYVFVNLNQIYCKDIHFKDEKNDKDGIGKNFKNFVNPLGDDEIFTKHERYARHVGLVTETILNHIVRQIKDQRNERSKKMSRSVLIQQMKTNVWKKMQRKRRKNRSRRRRI